MKYLLALVILSSCSPSSKQSTSYTSLPEELKDCKIFYISNGFNELTVVRCPNSDTAVEYTEQCGKTRCSRSTIVSDERKTK
jgi:hypothetical protein